MWRQHRGVNSGETESVRHDKRHVASWNWEIWNEFCVFGMETINLKHAFCVVPHDSFRKFGERRILVCDFWSRCNWSEIISIIEKHGGLNDKFAPWLIRSITMKSLPIIITILLCVWFVISHHSIWSDNSITSNNFDYKFRKTFFCPRHIFFGKLCRKS